MRWLPRGALVFTTAIGLLSATTAEASDDDGSARPRGTYVRVHEYDDYDPGPSLQAEPHALPGGTGQGAAHVLFLNRCTGGETVYGGWPDDSRTNTSSIIGGQVTFPEFPYGDSSWNELLTITKGLYAPFNVHVTDQDPGDVPHDEVIVCGTSGQAGFPGAGGVAPFSCGVIDNAISYVFAETMGNSPQALAEVIGQESAHAWGLEHEYDCRDPMTYLSPCGPKSFQNEDIACGEYNPRACECGGSTQNSYQMIMDIFGPNAPDTQAPVARITYPLDGDVFAPGESFTIEVDVSDDVELTRVAMYLDGDLKSDDTQAPFGPWPVSNVPEGTFTLHITAADGSGNEATSDTVTFYVSADGTPPPAPGGDDDGGDPGVDADDGGAVDDGGDGGGPGADVDSGALPADYGLYGDPAGCACTSGRDGSPLGFAWGLGLFVLGRVWTRRRRRR